MNRRNLIKGLAALPITSFCAAQAQLCTGGTCPSPGAGSLLVYLEGPFAVVLQRTGSDVNSVVAFSPVHQQHLGTVNGVPITQHPQQHQYQLPDDDPRLKHPLPRTCVSPDLQGVFCGENLGLTCDPKNSFVSIVLPRPKNIFTWKRRNGTNVKNESVCIPQDHILEYELVDSAKPPSLVYNNTKQTFPPISNVFHIEVGLDHPDQGGKHAIAFHNTSVLACFPSLQGDKQRQLASIQESFCASRTPDVIEVLAPRLKPFTSTLECKSGGIVGGNP